MAEIVATSTGGTKRNASNVASIAALILASGVSVTSPSGCTTLTASSKSWQTLMPNPPESIT